MYILWVAHQKGGKECFCTYTGIAHCAEMQNRLILYNGATVYWHVISLRQQIAAGPWKVNLKKVFFFVCYLNCWKLAPPANQWCSKSKGGTQQWHGSLEQTICVELHNSFPLAWSNFQVPPVSVSKTQWHLSTCHFLSLWFVFITNNSELKQLKAHLYILYILYIHIINIIHISAFIKNWKLLQ